MRIIIELSDEFIAKKTETKLNKEDNLIGCINRVFEFSAYTKLVDAAKDNGIPEVVISANDKTDSDISAFIVSIADNLHE